MSRRVEKFKQAKQPTALIYSSKNELPSLTNGSNGKHVERPFRINPETPEEREKRLKARKTLTLKVFKWAFDNNRKKA